MFNESEESNIILQGVLLTGIKDIKFDSSVNESSTKLLGNRGTKRKIYGPQKTTCSFSKPYNGKDFLQDLTGVCDLSGQFVYKNNAIDFSDAVISNYKLNLNEDGFGQVDVTLQIFGGIKPTTNLKLLSASQDFPVINKTPSILDFDLGGKNSPIKSLSYEASLSPEGSIDIGDINSSNIYFSSPTVHKISADIEILEQEIEDITGFLDDSKLKKNIEILFAPETSRSDIDEIKSIQSIVKDFQSSGIKTDDLDFSMGVCAYNAFQFENASISNQNLDASAGEGIRLRNEYNVSTNIEKVTGSIPVPNEYLSCEGHIQKLKNNLNILFERVDGVVFGDQINFEDHQVGQTGIVNVDKFKMQIDFENHQVGQTGMTVISHGEFSFQEFPIGLFTQGLFKAIEEQKEDFENFEINQSPTNIIPLDSFDIKETFENSGIGEAVMTDPNIIQKETFENSGLGGIDLNQIDEYDPSNEIDFESESNGEIQGLFTTIEEQKEDFEPSGLGSITFPKFGPLFIDDFFNLVDFELEPAAAIELDSPKAPPFEAEISFEDSLIGSMTLSKFEPLFIDDFFNVVDFELEAEGPITLNNLMIGEFAHLVDFELEAEGSTTLDRLFIDDFANLVDFELEAEGPTTLDRLFIDDFFNLVDFELESLGATTLNEIQIPNDFFNETDFELESIGSVALNELLGNSFFANEVNFYDQSIGETSTNLYSLEI